MRKRRTPIYIQDDNEVLRRFARLIAFSQNAQSDLVSEVIDRGVFDDIFYNFEINKVAKMDQSTIKAQH